MPTLGLGLPTRILKICEQCYEMFTLEWPLSNEAKVACKHPFGLLINFGTLGIGTERVYLCCQGDIGSKVFKQASHVFKAKEADLSRSNLFYLSDLFKYIT